jgi:hypothetical protein
MTWSCPRFESLSPSLSRNWEKVSVWNHNNSDSWKFFLSPFVVGEAIDFIVTSKRRDAIDQRGRQGKSHKRGNVDSGWETQYNNFGADIVEETCSSDKVLSEIHPFVRKKKKRQGKVLHLLLIQKLIPRKQESISLNRKNSGRFWVPCHNVRVSDVSTFYSEDQERSAVSTEGLSLERLNFHVFALLPSLSSNSDTFIMTGMKVSVFYAAINVSSLFCCLLLLYYG